MMATEVQLVVSIVKYDEHEGRRVGVRSGGERMWLVKLGLKVVGAVYKADDLGGQPEDEVFYERHRGRWLWEGPGEGCSLDQEESGSSYATRMEAVWGLLTQYEKDRACNSGLTDGKETKYAR